VATFEPAKLVLSPTRTSVLTNLRLQGAPRRREISLSAEDGDGDLQPGEGTVSVESSVEGVKLIAPAFVYSGRSYPVTVRLVDSTGTLQPADWDREIRLSAASGHFEPTGVVVRKDHVDETATYRAPDDPGQVMLRADGRLLSPDRVEVTVVASLATLFGAAGFGGVLGGLARYVYKVQSLALLPRRVKGTVEPGILGNGLFSALVGIVVFQAMEYGIRNPAWVLKGVPENGALAFFLGVLGGFGGVMTLDRCVEFLLPASRETASTAPRPEAIARG
jgi:hypothetical protein